MNKQPETKLGQQLWQLLPGVYRERDKGDLSNFLDAFGHVLDGLYHTLHQRMDDIFPDTCQTWLLPYIAKLLDVRLVSPTPAGQRREVARAIAWRKEKGTVANIEQIANAVGRLQDDTHFADEMEFEIQEAWKRIACTSKLNTPLLPGAAFGTTDEIDPGNPIAAAGYTGLPQGTVDFRKSARAQESLSAHSRTRYTRFSGESVQWEIRYPKGAPCFPDSFEDPSVRTVDLRTANWRKGHYHPKKALLFYPPPAGFFHPEAPQMNWDQRMKPDNSEKWTFDEEQAKTHDGRDLIIRTYSSVTLDHLLAVTGDVTLDDAPPPDTELLTRFIGFYFKNQVIISQGRMAADQCAFNRLEILDQSMDQPALDAKNSLIRQLTVPRGLTRLEYCTVLEQATIAVLHAGDTIFAGPFKKDPGYAPKLTAGIRFCSFPQQDLSDFDVNEFKRHEVVQEKPVFFSDQYGEPGCGVLHPGSDEFLCSGAELGGEIGAYHHRYYCSRLKAVDDKLQGFLPAGMQSVMVPDPRLLKRPPKPIITT